MISDVKYYFAVGRFRATPVIFYVPRKAIFAVVLAWSIVTLYATF